MAVLPSFFTDFLQQFPFWLFDVSPIDSFGLPLFTPLFGFSRVTSPEVSLTTQAIKEGNWHFTRKVITGANVSPITMERGVFWLDSDFWRWTQATIFGDPDLFRSGLGGVPGPSVRRNIMLIHFFSRGPIGGAQPKASTKDGVTRFSDPNFDAAKAANVALGAAGLVGLGAIGLGLTGEAVLGPAGQQVLLATGGFTATNALSPGSAVRIPAKAWLLFGALPTRYKVASDFDASSSAVSLAELEIEYERFEEISLAS